MLNNKYTQRTIWFILLVIIWQSIVLSGRFSPLIFPSPLSIIQTLYNSIISGELLKQVLFSLSLIGQGLFISLILAFVISLLSSLSELIAGLVDTLIAIAHPLPGIALMPLVLIWLGAGKWAVIVIIIHSVLWPLVLNLITGFRSIPRIYRLVGENYGLNKMEIMWQIMAPASLPYFLAGLKIGWARAWRALISAEMLFGAAGSFGGLGWFIFKKRVFFDLPGVFAGIIVIIIIGMLVEDLIFNNIEKMTVQKWGIQQ